MERFRVFIYVYLICNKKILFKINGYGSGQHKYFDEYVN